MKNKHGLSRDIPADVKRAVRQRDGFGCVICGLAVIDYEHFDPEFADAQSHAVDGIVLLCIGHHGLKTRGLLSKSSIAKAMANPMAKQQGFSHGPFDLGAQSPEVVIGNVSIRNTPILLRVEGDDLLTIKPPEEPGGPFRLSAYVTDRNGRLQLAITDNEWQTPTGNWDVAVVGPRITIRSGIRDIDLVLRSDPPERLTFERIRMVHKGFSIHGQIDQPTVIAVGDDTVLHTNAARVDGSQIGIEVTKEGIGLGYGGGSTSFSGVINPAPDPKPASNVINFPNRSAD